MKNLISCRARVEMKAIDRKSGKILFIDRENDVAVDIAENFAGKKAIQEAAYTLAERLVKALVAKRYWGASSVVTGHVNPV